MGARLGGFLGRSTAAAPNFPPIPTVPTQAARQAAPAISELERNRAITDMLNRSTITTQAQETKGAAPTTVDAKVAASTGLESDDLVELVVLHARQPERWDAEALANKFSVSNKAALQSALKYVAPFRVEADESGRNRAIRIERGDEGDEKS